MLRIRYALAVSAVFALVWAGCDSAITAPEASQKSISPAVPLAVGNEWTYEAHLLEMRNGEVVAAGGDAVIERLRVVAEHHVQGTSWFEVVSERAINEGCNGLCEPQALTHLQGYYAAGDGGLRFLPFFAVAEGADFREQVGSAVLLVRHPASAGDIFERWGTPITVSAIDHAVQVGESDPVAGYLLESRTTTFGDVPLEEPVLWKEVIAPGVGLVHTERHWYGQSGEASMAFTGGMAWDLVDFTLVATEGSAGR